MIINYIINKILSIKKRNQGASLIELLFYIAIFAVLFLVVINSMVFMTRSFRETVVNTDLTQTVSVMERISREIRNATSINTVSSTSLKLNTIDSVTAAESTIRFSLSGSNIELYDGSDVLVGNLNSQNISVTDLRFAEITTVEGKAVKFVVTVKSNHYNSVRTEKFYDTVVLRGAYQ